MTDAARGAVSTTHVSAITEFLDGARIAHEVIEHDEVMSAAAEASATHVPPDQVAKTVVLLAGDAYVIAAIPASERLDLHKLRDILGAPRELHLATEDQIAREFPAFAVGAIPPFGPMVPAAEVIDRRLLEHPRVLCPAGDHRHSVFVDPRDVITVTKAHTGDICQD